MWLNKVVIKTTECFQFGFLFSTLLDEENVCSLPLGDKHFDADIGAYVRCSEHIPSWYFNSESGDCEEFIYGGCGGNANRFETKKICENRCLSDSLSLIIRRLFE